MKSTAGLRRRLPEHPAVAFIAWTVSSVGIRGIPKKVPNYLRAAYHAMFMHVMLIRPTGGRGWPEFEKPDFVIYNAGQFPANSRTPLA